VKNLTFLGDSLTAGYGLENPAMQSVPGLTQQKIDAAGLDWRVYNGGSSGSTSANGLYRLDNYLRRPIDAFVLQLGINDLIRKMPVERTRENLSKIIAKVLQKNPQCKLALMGMRIPAKHLYNNLYPALAAQYNIAFVPFYLYGVSGVSALNLGDKLHPNAEGYEVIAENIWPVIRELL
jgi:acyl-CoA thioesterase-1